MLKSTVMIQYYHTTFAWSNYIPIIEDIVLSNNLHKILEIGGGANPVLSKKFVQQTKIEYTVNDIEATELAKMKTPFPTDLTNFATADFEMKNTYDFIFSKMVMEHVEEAALFHRNIFQALRPGGYAFHFFPCLGTLPLVINYYLKESIARKILPFFQNRNLNQHDKFPAFYHWCEGPTPNNIKRFEKLGFELKAYYGFYGHQYYKVIPPLHYLEQLKAKLLLKYPQAKLCVNAFIVLKKPNYTV